jgi:NADPH2:quinone reductase
MKAIVVTRFEGPDGLEVRELAEPIPAGDQVLVKVEAAGVNFADIRSAMGLYPGGPKPPYVAGREFAGVIESTGQRVMGYSQQDACAGKIAISRNSIWPQPAGWTSIQAAAFPVNYFTAWLVYWKAGVVAGMGSPDHAPVRLAPPQAKAGNPATAPQRAKTDFHPSANAPGTPGLVGNPAAPQQASGSPDSTPVRPVRVLIHAAAGGVGTAAVQLGRLMGFETFGTTSSDEKLERLRALGLNHAINYAREDYEQKIKEVTDGEGVDVVFDSLAGEHTAKSLRCCAFLGRVVLFGSSSGERPKFDTLAMYERSLSAHGLWLSRLSKHRALIDQALGSMQPWIDSGQLKPVIGAKFPFEAAAESFRLLLGRKNFGKVVLTVG